MWFAFTAVPAVAPLFFALWSLLFRMLRFARLLVFFLRVLFHVLWLRLLVSILLPRFSACCGSGCPFLFLSPFRSGVFLSVLWTSSWFSVSCASGSPSLLMCLRLSSMLRVLLWLYLGRRGAVFPAFLLVFFPLVFLCMLRASSLSLGLRSLPWCLFLLVFVVVFFAPVLVLSPPVLPFYVAVAFGCLFSDSFESSVPVATWSPFGTSQVGFSLCFSWFLVACVCWYPFLFVSAPFLCLVRIGGYLCVMFSR